MIFACGSYMRKNSALAESLVDVPGHNICPEEHSKTENFLFSMCKTERILFPCVSAPRVLVLVTWDSWGLFGIVGGYLG